MTRASAWMTRGLAVLGIVFTASAQDFRALVSGRVIDSSGAAIAGASITVVDPSTQFRASAVTRTDGTFAFPELSPGTYELAAGAPGFKRYLRQGMRLAVGGKANLEIQMEVGDITSAVTVNAELAGVEASEGITSQLMEARNVSELPLNGRNVYMLVQLSAGVVFTQQNFAPGGSSGTRAYDLYGQFSVHGSLPNTSAFLLDGVPVETGGQSDYVPLVDGVEEFKVSSPMNDASQGLTSGGVVNMTMKRGTNSLHGTLSHFLRNQVFDAVRTQEKYTAAANPTLAHFQHQFNDASAVVTGPIVKNKLFFLGSYEGFWDRVPRAITTTVPTIPQRAGDFSQTFNAAGQLVVIYDPLTTQQSGNSFTRTPFAGNVIPPNRIVAVSQNILKFVPLPNVATLPVTNFNNLGVAPNVGKFAYNAWYMKFNYDWTAKHRTFFSETQNYGSNNSSTNGIPTGNPAKLGPIPRGGIITGQRSTTSTPSTVRRSSTPVSPGTAICRICTW